MRDRVYAIPCRTQIQYEYGQRLVQVFTYKGAFRGRTSMTAYLISPSLVTPYHAQRTAWRSHSPSTSSMVMHLSLTTTPQLNLLFRCRT